MKPLFISLFAAFLAVLLPIQDAEAKRLGGGRSAGMQRDALPQKPVNPQRDAGQRDAGQQAAPAQPGAPAQAGKRNWLGPVAGLAAGLGLAALASHLGLGEEFANFLMIALLVMAAIFLFKWLAGRRAASAAQPMRYAGAGAGGPMATPPATPLAHGGALPTGPSAQGLPAGFDAEAFTRQAKLNFIRLQAASDAGNLEDLREFTTPEMYAELKLQLDERGAAESRTEVVNLDAEVLDAVEEPSRLIVSVRFHGLIREDGAAEVPFDEVWHLTKPTAGKGGWVIAGIQQLQ